MDTSNILRSFGKFKKFYYSAFKPLLKASGLSQNQIDVMLFLANNPGFDRAQDVIDMRNMSKSQVSKSVDELVCAGYIAKKIDDSDRRNARLKLAPAADEIVSEAKKIQNFAFDALFINFDDVEKRAVQAMLSKLDSAVDEASNGLD